MSVCVCVSNQKRALGRIMEILRQAAVCGVVVVAVVAAVVAGVTEAVIVHRA